ncbi:hypothetical protein JKP88DRAFT_271333 [Tribonema minus]|uniref:Extrinsic protein in photosystem II n=1 Tax=Tribonema minus TaxID=303371 RepID=A0A835ZLX1_9STRA|nr:hypothetical protein JKP88DRAFT_271333 [Tribonema minus]
MAIKAVVLLAVLAVCQAFVPSMTANSGLSRADFAKVLAAGVAGTAAPALALGASPKQNLFGVIGTAPMVGGGGMSSPYSEADTYSPYSPYSATEDGTAVYTGVTDEMSKRYIDVIKDCKNRFEKIPGWVAGSKWMEIRAELTRKAYSLRGAMNALAASPEAKAAAKDYYADLEVMMTEARNKDGAKISAAYAKSVSDLSTYLSKL